MKIDVLVTPSNQSKTDAKESVGVVIDVLRACSTISNALKNGCREVIPVESIERALGLQSTLFDSNILLCGERECVKIEGFRLGNSPLEYLREDIEGKSLIFTSTNFSNTVLFAKNYQTTFIASLLNAETVSKKLVELKRDVVFICAGYKKQFSLEDFICAGMMINTFTDLYEEEYELSDSSLAAKEIYKKFENTISEAIKNSDHGKRLIKAGFQKDIDFCLKVNSSQLLPVYKEGKVTLT